MDLPQRQEKTVQHWNKAAASYDLAKRRNNYYFDTLKELCSSLLPNASRQRILEVGCGTGDLLAHLQPATGLGIDLSPQMVEQARDKFRLRSNLHFEVAAAEDLNQLGRRFDAVIMCDVLEHVQDVRAALAAPKAVLVSGGHFLVSTSNPMWALPLWLLEKLRLKMPEGPHRWVALPEIRRILDQNGFTIDQSGYRTLIPARIPLVSTLANRRLMQWGPWRKLGLTEFALARAVG